MNYQTIEMTIAVYVSYVDWKKEYVEQSDMAKELLKEMGNILSVPMAKGYKGGYSRWVYHYLIDIQATECVFYYGLN